MPPNAAPSGFYASPSSSSAAAAAYAAQQQQRAAGPPPPGYSHNVPSHLYGAPQQMVRRVVDETMAMSRLQGMWPPPSAAQPPPSGASPRFGVNDKPQQPPPQQAPTSQPSNVDPRRAAPFYPSGAAAARGGKVSDK